MRAVATIDYLANPADLAAWLGVPENDPKLIQALAAATSRFRGAVRHPVTLVAGDTVTLDGTGCVSLILPAAPVLSVASLELDGEPLVEGEGFDWSADGFLRRLGCQVWPGRLRCVVVTYSHGHAQVPDDVAEAVIDQARAMYAVRPGVESVQVGGQALKFGAQASIGVTAQWSAAVERHRLNRGDRP
ncbi:mobile element protein [Streptomyces sp. NBC_01775]|uniref:mobile element protein n=1 Tax=Streptomyces sp. NBC_01775 TaxID=2975939 RepID=UPI002DD858DF|nr:mobile element protein [Streptomyces sp. NBC_01775]WSB74731.1 mobile element protein [Streptomyces sp. NBC_01775]